MTPEEEKIYADRQLVKERNQKYRDAVARLYPHTRVTLTSTVIPGEDGAYVEVHVWVPNEELR